MPATSMPQAEFSAALRVYFIPPEIEGDQQLRLVEAALRGGAGTIQLRLKHAGGRKMLALAEDFLALTRRFGAQLIVNDRVDVALACGADGVHVGQDDLPLRAVKELVEEGLYVGVSAGTVDEAVEAETAGADYIGAGPVFPTPSKDDAGPAIGIEGLRAICSAVSVPVVAIGGINGERLPQVKAAGAAGVAVISAISEADDPEHAAVALLKLYNADHERITR